MKIFYDDDLENEVLGLVENNSYIVDFTGSSDEEVEKEIKKAALEPFLDWQKGNRFGRLKIVNYIGVISLFDKLYDVRSPKFLTDLSGAEQFQFILRDVQELAKNLIYTYVSPSFVFRETDYDDVNPSLLIAFNYFKNIILDKSHSYSLNTLLTKILKNPNFKYVSFHSIDHVNNVQTFDNKSLRAVASSSKHYSILDETNNAVRDLPIARYLSKGKNNPVFPTKLLMRKKSLSYDTQENRFVKFFLEYIESTTLRLNSINNLPPAVNEQKDQVLSFCRNALNTPFFKEVKKMTTMPSHSPVLQNRAGYKEILSHYNNSRFGIKYLYKSLEEENSKISLKKISDLYEFWVFYKIVYALMGQEVEASFFNDNLDNAELKHGVCFSKGNISVYYNLTESRSRNTAYSTPLRPDITVLINTAKGKYKFLFDAKYKVRDVSDDGGIVRHVKTEDLYKMHTYLDAIDDSVCSVAVYPGDEFYFYEKSIKKPINRNVEEVQEFSGVGAIPLTPTNKEHELKLSEFLMKLKDYAESLNNANNNRQLY